MTSYSQKLSPDYVRTYRTMLQNMSKPKIVPKDPSTVSKIYMPSSTVSTYDANTVFFPLFYAGEKGALGIFDKRSGVGTVKRRLDDDDRTYHVLELSNPRTNLGTYIATPKSALNALHITLPHMVMTMKNYRRNFAFEVLIMDSNAYRRRFSFATWYNPAALKKFSFMCQVPLRLEIGWNEIHVDFNELVKSTYKTTFVETIRVQIYANCKLRQIFFCDDKIIKGEIPIPSMRDFNNIRIVPLDYGPRTHPDGIEQGPEKKRNVPYVDPPAQVAPTRLEQDLKSLQRRRELIHEEKQHKKMEKAAAAAMAAKYESTSKSVKSENSNRTVDEQEVGDSNLSAVTVPMDSTGISNIFNPKPDEIRQLVSEMSQKDRPIKLPTITEENEMGKLASKKTANAAEDNLRNNNISERYISKLHRAKLFGGPDSPSVADSIASSQAEPSLHSFKPPKNYSLLNAKSFLK